MGMNVVCFTFMNPLLVLISDLMQFILLFIIGMNVVCIGRI